MRKKSSGKPGGAGVHALASAQLLLLAVTGCASSPPGSARPTPAAPATAGPYHSLKAIAHVPLAIFVALTPGEGPLDAERLGTLEHLRQLILPARASLPRLGLSAALLAPPGEHRGRVARVPRRGAGPAGPSCGGW